MPALRSRVAANRQYARGGSFRAAPPKAVVLDHLTDLAALIQTAEGFDSLLTALRKGRAA